jgi:hypothetical protein
VDLGGGHHGNFALGFGPIDDAVENPPLTTVQEPTVAFSSPLAVAFSGLLEENRIDSKTSVTWSSEDIFLAALKISEVFESLPSNPPTLPIKHGWLRSNRISTGLAQIILEQAQDGSDVRRAFDQFDDRIDQSLDRERRCPSQT